LLAAIAQGLGAKGLEDYEPPSLASLMQQAPAQDGETRRQLAAEHGDVEEA